MSETFVVKGFSNWKDATSSFKKHQASKAHGEAVQAVITLPKTTKNVGDLLSSAYTAQREQARDMLRIILSSVRFLARQGLALRGNTSDESANLIQLLHLRGEDKPELLRWIEKSSRKHISPENQNEMLQIMAHHVLRSILLNIQSSPFISVMVDETTDKSNREQLTFIMRWVSNDFAVGEEFLGLYTLSSTNTQSIVDVMKDAFLRFQIPIQWYDGCSTMAGTKGGVAAKIAQLEPRAVFTHCFGHALNLSVSDTKNSTAMKDCLNTCYELVKLIKFSPKRVAMLRGIKEELDSNSPSVRTLCPTRWTVRADSLASIMANYSCIQLLWETAVNGACDMEMKARIRGVDSQMQTFKFFFCITLSEMILRHTDKLTQTLQQPSLSSVEGHAVSMLTVLTLTGLRTEGNFDLLWEKVLKIKEEVDVGDPQLPRKRKVPRRYEEGMAESEYPHSPKDEYRRIYFEALDLAVSSIRSRFDQKGFKIFSSIKQLLLKACSGKSVDEDLKTVCDFFYDDFDKEELASELLTLRTLYTSVVDSEEPSIESVKRALLSLSSSQRALIGTVSRVFQLLLVLPATNATSERSFSSLRRIKSYLRTTMSQSRLNHLMILHYHQDLCDELDMDSIGNEYISKNDTRRNTFALFKNH